METAKAIGIVLGPTISFEALMVNAWITKNAPMAITTTPTPSSSLRL